MSTLNVSLNDCLKAFEAWYINEAPSGTFRDSAWQAFRAAWNHQHTAGDGAGGGSGAPYMQGGVGFDHELERQMLRSMGEAVPVSLEKCAAVINNYCDKRTNWKMTDMAKAVLDAAGVPYVD